MCLTQNSFPGNGLLVDVTLNAYVLVHSDIQKNPWYNMNGTPVPN